MADNNTNQQNIVLHIGVEGQQDVQAAQQSVAELNQQAKNAGKVDMANPAKTLKQELRLALADLQRLVNSGDTTSKKFRDAAKEVARLKDEIGDTNATVAAFDPDNKFKVLGQAAGAAAKGVQGYAGAMTLLGDNSKDTQETLLKLNALMALSDSLNSINDIRDAYKNMKAVITTNVAAFKDWIAEKLSFTSAQQVETAAIAENSAVAEANAVAVEESTALTAAQGETAVATAGMMEGATVATEGATLASKAFGLALKSLGIGLIIAAIALLVEKWDDIKKAVTGFLAPGKESGEVFDSLKAKAFGLGNAILQFIIGPYKAAYHLISSLWNGDGIAKGWDKAQADLKKMFAVTQNFNEEADKKTKEYAKGREGDKLNDQITADERMLKVRQKAGDKSYDLELSIANKKLKLLKDYNKEYGKEGAKEIDDEKKKNNAIADAQADIDGVKAAHQKELNDKAKKEREKLAAERKEELKKELDEIKRFQEEAKKVLREDDAGNPRQAELADVTATYQKELALLDKAHKTQVANAKGNQNEIKKLNAQYDDEHLTLVEAKKKAEAKINKKYDDEVKDYLTKVQGESLNAYQKKALEINTEIDKQLEKAKGNATLIKQLEDSRKVQLGNNQELSDLTNKANSTKANADITKANNVITYGDNNVDAKLQETPESAKAKVHAINVAMQAQEDADFELKKAQIIQQDAAMQALKMEQQGKTDDINGSDMTDDEKSAALQSLQDEYTAKMQIVADGNAALEALQQSHAATKKNIDDQSAQAGIQIAQAEADHKKKIQDGVMAGLEQMSELVGQNTLAGKAMAIAAATINTYQGATEALKNPWPLNLIAMAATITAGLLSVKKIISTKVPTSGGSGGGNSAPSNAPVINSTILSQTSSGSSNVVNAVNAASTAQQQSQTNVRAYIVNKDLNNQQTTNDYYKNQSTY